MTYANFKDVNRRTFADKVLGFRFLLCVIDIFSKYAWVIPLKDIKELQLLILFKKS